jgi:hypothetical protein
MNTKACRFSLWKQSAAQFMGGFGQGLSDVSKTSDVVLPPLMLETMIVPSHGGLRVLGEKIDCSICVVQISI